MEGMANEKLGNRDKASSQLQHAGELLSSLEQKWGTDVFNSYLKRNDVQAYRARLTANSDTRH